LGSTPHHPPRHLVLPPQINPRILPRQQQLDPGVEDAGSLEGGNGAAAAVKAQVEGLLGVVDGQALLGDGGYLRQELLLPIQIQGLIGLQGASLRYVTAS
jgi:hypothetical protein